MPIFSYVQICPIFVGPVTYNWPHPNGVYVAIHKAADALVLVECIQASVHQIFII